MIPFSGFSLPRDCRYVVATIEPEPPQERSTGPRLRHRRSSLRQPQRPGRCPGRSARPKQMTVDKRIAPARRPLRRPRLGLTATIVMRLGPVGLLCFVDSDGGRYEFLRYATSPPQSFRVVGCARWIGLAIVCTCAAPRAPRGSRGRDASPGAVTRDCASGYRHRYGGLPYRLRGSSSYWQERVWLGHRTSRWTR